MIGRFRLGCCCFFATDDLCETSLRTKSRVLHEIDEFCIGRWRVEVVVGAEVGIAQRLALSELCLIELHLARANDFACRDVEELVIVTLSLIHISEPTRRTPISYAVFCL